MRALPEGPLAQRRGGGVRPQRGGLGVKGMDAATVPGECWCTRGCAERFAAAVRTRLLIPCHGTSVQSPVSPSLSLFLLPVLFAPWSRRCLEDSRWLVCPGSSVAWLSFGAGAVPCVYPTAVVVPLPFSVLCFTYEVIIYTGICIQIYVQASLGRSGLHALLQD